MKNKVNIRIWLITKSDAVPAAIPINFSFNVLGHASTAEMRMAVGTKLVHSAVTSKVNLFDVAIGPSTSTELPKRFQIDVASHALRSRRGCRMLLWRRLRYTTAEIAIQEKKMAQKRTMWFSRCRNSFILKRSVTFLLYHECIHVKPECVPLITGGGFYELCISWSAKKGEELEALPLFVSKTTALCFY